MKKVFLFASVAAIAMTSCSNDTDFGGSSEGGKLQVSADIDEVRTRASGTSWDANDAIGVSEEGSSTYTNVKFVTTDGDGKFTSEESFYLLGDESHTIKAYYPYSENVESGSITFTEPTDFMYGTATATRQSPEAKLTFKHQMSQLSFTLSDPAATKSDDTSSEAVVTLHKIVKGGTFDTTTGTVTAGTTTEDYKITTTMGSKASFILPPQTFTNNGVSVSVQYNGKTYSATISLDKSTQGTNTQYTLAVSKDTESTNLVVSSETITDWTAIDKGNVDMTEQEVPNKLEIGDFLLSDGTVVDKDYELAKLTDKTVVGVVYYVGNAQPSVLYSGTYTETQDILKADAPNATNGLAIAIKNGNDGATARMFSSAGQFNYATSWYTVENNSDAASYIGTTLNINYPGEKFLGYNNTAVIEKVGDTYNETITGVEFTEILSKFREANTVSGDVSKWYLPSYAELKQIQDNYSIISTSITKAGGTLEQFSDFTFKTTEKFYWSSDLRSAQYAWISPLAETTGQEHYSVRNSSNYKGYFRFAIAF